MGSKLPVLAAVQVMLLAATASADPAGDLFKQGIELYKQGKYAEAVAVLAKSYKVDARPDVLFALAQAERLAGNCDAAAKHYRKMLDSSTDLNTAKLVETNLALCETINDVDKKKEEPKPAPPPEPRVVVKAVPHTDKLATTMFAGGMLGLGAAGGLYIASRTARSDAGRARTFDDYQTLSDRADRDQLMSFVVGGVSAALVGVAVFKWTRSSGEQTVAVTPSAHGTTISFTGRW